MGATNGSNLGEKWKPDYYGSAEIQGNVGIGCEKKIHLKGQRIKKKQQQPDIL